MTARPASTTVGLMSAPARARPGAVDPRLLLYARATRPFLVALVVLGVITALLIIAQAWLLAYVIAAVLGAGTGAAALVVPLAALLGVVVGRAVVAWGRELLAHRASAHAKAQLRTALLEHLGALGPKHLRGQRAGELAVLATRGIDALDGYFSLYLPQLFLAVIVPAAVLVAVGVQDWISALIIAATLPLIPLFMALVGAATRDRMDAAVPDAAAAGRALPGRRRRPAHAEGIRSREGADRRPSARSPIATARRRSRRSGSPSCPR